VPLLVPSGHLRQALLGLRALGFAGAELAEPYQRDALDYVEEVSPAAAMLRAVKHITIDERGRLVGDYVHWLGFSAVLRTLVSSLDGLRPLIIGAGIAARSVVYALTREGLPVTILDERIERAIDLVHQLRHTRDEHSFSVYRWPQDLIRVAPNANLIVYATAVGMGPDFNGSPWPDDLPFPPGALVFDLVSWPNATRFLRQARAGGAKTVGGLSVLVYEAALALERWTRQPWPMGVMWQVTEQTVIEQNWHNTGKTLVTCPKEEPVNRPVSKSSKRPMC
jgi:shikimate dehydrogenase